MVLVTLPDLVGDNQAHRLDDLMSADGIALPDPCVARLLIVRELTGGASGSRVGDDQVSATRGLTLSASEGVFLPPVAIGGGLAECTWDLESLWVFAARGDTLNIAIAL
jgi:hypothetical protein